MHLCPFIFYFLSIQRRTELKNSAGTRFVLVLCFMYLLTDLPLTQECSGNFGGRSMKNYGNKLGLNASSRSIKLHLAAFSDKTKEYILVMASSRIYKNFVHIEIYVED